MKTFEVRLHGWLHFALEISSVSIRTATSCGKVLVNSLKVRAGVDSAYGMAAQPRNVATNCRSRELPAEGGTLSTISPTRLCDRAQTQPEQHELQMLQVQVQKHSGRKLAFFGRAASPFAGLSALETVP